jgi:hypothetical protein
MIYVAAGCGIILLGIILFLLWFVAQGMKD